MNFKIHFTLHGLFIQDNGIATLNYYIYCGLFFFNSFINFILAPGGVNINAHAANFAFQHEAVELWGSFLTVMWVLS